jgi:hypothetical protein
MTNISKSYNPHNFSLDLFGTKVEGLADGNLIVIESLHSLATQAKSYFNNQTEPTTDEWDYFFMCESIEDKEKQEKIKEKYMEIINER